MKEALVPVITVGRHEEQPVVQCEGMSFIEVLYEGELARLKQKGLFLVYLCAPLRATQEKSAQQHILEAFRAASQIMGARWKGQDVTIWIPHLHGLTVFNELNFPHARGWAVAYNCRLMRQRLFDALLVVGTEITEGTKSEIRHAGNFGLEVINYDKFKAQAERLPSFNKSLDYLDGLVNLYRNNLHRFFIP